MDRLKDGQITVDDLKSVYSVKKNPKYLASRLIKNELMHSLIIKLCLFRMESSLRNNA